MVLKVSAFPLSALGAACHCPPAFEQISYQLEQRWRDVAF